MSGVTEISGTTTQKACDACDPPDAVARYCSIREALYRRFAQAPGQDRFLVGWMNRLNALARAKPECRASRSAVPTEIDFGDTDHIERVPDISPTTRSRRGERRSRSRGPAGMPVPLWHRAARPEPREGRNGAVLECGLSGMASRRTAF